MKEGEKRIYISANSPGEISGWLMPVVKTIKKLLPEYKVSVIVLPCTFASGREKQVISSIPEVDEVIPESRFISLFFDRSDKTHKELLYLGGDITYTAWLARRWRISAWAYLWGNRSNDRWYRGYFVRTENDRAVLEGRGIKATKIFIVGDLLKDHVMEACAGCEIPPSPRHPETICFMPGSRLREVRSLMPFYLEIAALLQKAHGGLKFKALISPFIDWDELMNLGTIEPLRELGGLKGTIDGEKKLFFHDDATAITLVHENHLQEMARSDFVVTIPGTKTGEAGCLGKPMLVLLPLNKPEDLPYKGIVGLLDAIPLLGPKIKAFALRRMAEQFTGWVSLPNMLACREVVPEYIGVMKASQVAEKIGELFRDEERIKKMRSDLESLYDPFEGTTKRMIGTFARAVKAGYDSEKPYYSIIICTKNRRDILKAAIATLDSQDYPPRGYEVLIIDDGSDDGTREMVAALSTKCRLRYYPRSWSGRAGARNFGISEAAGEVVIFVDDDILAPPWFISEHAGYHRRYPRTIVRGPIINIETHSFPRDGKAKLRDFSQAFFCTCNVSVGRQELIEAGGFDETFKEYGFEDNEAGWRLRERGLTVRFNMEALVYHYKPRKNEEDFPSIERTARELARSAFIYFRKHPHLQVRLATGIHPLSFVTGWWTCNRFLRECREREWKRRVKNGSGDLTDLERKLSQCYYGETLREEMKKIRGKQGPQAI
ncbi:MAG: glycosyltransferase [Candidatus Eremiobacteraeota bacterium]|nr:glycosyltransferase [Candidatus Eremiobacteraeota bacterium]